MLRRCGFLDSRNASVTVSEPCIDTTGLLPTLLHRTCFTTHGDIQMQKNQPVARSQNHVCAESMEVWQGAQKAGGESSGLFDF